MKKIEAAKAVLKEARKPMDFATFHQRIERKVKVVIGRQELRMMISELKRAGELRDDGRAETRRVWAA